MAKFFDVWLDKVEISPGIEDCKINAEIFLKGEKVGMFFDEGSGGSSILKFCCEQDTKKEFYYSVWRYFASYPEIDRLALYDYTQKEFSELKGTLPKIDYKGWADEKVSIFFIDRLIYLWQIEEQFKSAMSEGYEAIVVAQFYNLKNAKASPDKIYYTDGSAEQLNQVIELIEQTNKNYTVSQYSSINDFVIG